MPELIITLLGGFEARTADGTAFSFPTKKTRALLAYLAIHPGRSHSRSDLASLLWGNSGDDQARASLRQTLSYLRKTLLATGETHLVMKDDLVSINPSTVQVDVVMFEGMTWDDIARSIEPGGNFYPGDLLEGFDLRDEAFNSWLAAERARLRAYATEILKYSLAHYMTTDQLDEGLRVANRLLAHDPLQEKVHRALMRLHLRRGERALALKQYENCRQILQSELGVEPDEETRRIWVEASAVKPQTDANGGSLALEHAPIGSGGAQSPPATSAPRSNRRQKWDFASLSLAVMAGLVVIGFAMNVIWHQPSPPKSKPALAENMAFPLPDRPSIAVLPFLNISGDPEQEYFADGMTDDIITDLAKVSKLFVIARNSTFAYKGKSVDVRRVSRDLGVRHVLEGSVRREGGRVRVNAQLINATTGGHVWAERYDADLADIFVLQDKLTRSIVDALVENLSASDEQRLAQKDTTSVLAHDAYLQGLTHYEQRTRPGLALAKRLMLRAVELDPNYSRAYAALAAIYWRAWETYWYKDLGLDSWFEAWVESEFYLGKAMKNPTPLAHQIASRMLYTTRNFDEAIVHAQQAVALEPNRAGSYVNLASVLNMAGRQGEAVTLIKKAMRLDPQYPASFLLILGHAQFHMEKFSSAASILERAAERNPDDRHARMYLAATYGHLDRPKAASAEVATVNELRAEINAPKLRTNEVRSWPYQKADDTERMIIGLRKAGVPEN